MTTMLFAVSCLIGAIIATAFTYRRNPNHLPDTHERRRMLIKATREQDATLGAL